MTFRGLLSATAFTACFAIPLIAEEAVIVVDASKVKGRISPLLAGACIEDVNHEIYGGLYSQMIFGESFQEPPPSPKIEGFKSYGGEWRIENGIARITATDGQKLVADSPQAADGRVGVELRFEESRGDNAGLIVRVNRPGLGSDAFTGYEVALDPSRQMLRVARHRNNYELIRDTPCSVPVGRWVELAVETKGSVIEVFVDSKSILRYDDARSMLPAGSVGLRGWQCNASFRNLWTSVAGSRTAIPFSTPQPVPRVSGMWRPTTTGTAKADFSLTRDRSFVGGQSQVVKFVSGEGSVGVENKGLNRWGMKFVAGMEYEGYVRARADKRTTIWASLQSSDGSRTLAEMPLEITSERWTLYEFKLTPQSNVVNGRFALTLKSPGEVVLGHAFLQPGEWGRFKGLPVRRDVAFGLKQQGVKVLRYGGSMVNHREYRWKKMVGPRDSRPPQVGTWYPHSTNGWGILDFMDICEAAGFECIPDFNTDESPQDMADFVEYATGSPESPWGAKRVATGRAKPYSLKYVELGNEERVDEVYGAKFEKIAKAMWAKNPDLILVVGDFEYTRPISDPSNVAGATSGIRNLDGHRRILKLAKEHKREVWFDIHLWTSSPTPSPSVQAFSTYIDALTKIADGAKHRVVVFELNADNHDMARALSNALAIHSLMRDGRVPIVCSANCLQPDGQNDNGWNQGLLFLNPSTVWLQPPGYVTQMMSFNHQPQLVESRVRGSSLDVVGAKSEDGRKLVIQCVNAGDKAVTIQLMLEGFKPAKTIAEVTTLAGELRTANTSKSPAAVAARESTWAHQSGSAPSSLTVPPRSFMVVRFE